MQNPFDPVSQMSGNSQRLIYEQANKLHFTASSYEKHLNTKKEKKKLHLLLTITKFLFW